MGCRCGCNSGMCGPNLLIVPSFRRGLRGLGEIRAGSKGRVGFSFPHVYANPFGAGYSELINILEGCLYSTGAFNEIKVTIDSGYVTDYLLITFTLAVGFGKADDIGSLVEGTIRSCYPDRSVLDIGAHDSVKIDAVPSGTDPATIPVENRPSSPNQQSQSQPNSLLSLVGLGGGSSGSGSSTTLVLAIVAAVVIAKALK